MVDRVSVGEPEQVEDLIRVRNDDVMMMMMTYYPFPQLLVISDILLYVVLSCVINSIHS